MTDFKTPPPAGQARGEPLRQRVLDAAESLLGGGKAEFSMRELAAAAGVSFATPFNQFGSKAAIMHALSERRIDTMIRRFTEAPAPARAAERVQLAIRLAAEVMLEKPEVNRVVMGWIGTAGPSTGTVLAHSERLWTMAIGAGEGLIAARRDEALRVLPRYFALGFRGALSFWTAGELANEALATNAAEIANALLLGFEDPGRH